MEERSGVCKVLVGKSKGKRPLRRTRRRRILRKRDLGVMDWIELTQDTDRWRALVNAIMNLPVP
jgi:hypothetical protein